MAHHKPLHKYFGVNDFDCHSRESLALTEIEAKVKVVTTFVVGYLHGRGFISLSPKMSRAVW